MKERLVSLDLLRGFDLFLLVALCPLIIRIPGEAEWLMAVKAQLTHCIWEGFNLWDLVMPLFLFCAGTSIPFALSKFQSRELPAKKLFYRITKRFILLWILGMFVQGNLLGFENVKPITNTLQAIAIGYFFCSLIFVYLKRYWWYIIGTSLLLIYWGIIEFFGGGDWSATTNIAQTIDRSVLGVLVDGARQAPGGEIIYAPWYHYAWIIPSLNFIVTVLLGVIAGDFIKNNKQWSNGFTKFWWLLGFGLTILNLGWFWDNILPVIKPIWSSSMVLVSGGWCFILLAIFYLLFDVLRWGQKWTGWLKVYSVNSIVAYVITEGINWSSVSSSIFGGLANISGPWHSFIIEFGIAAIVYFILWLLYKNKVYIKV